MVTARAVDRLPRNTHEDCPIDRNSRAGCRKRAVALINHSSGRPVIHSAEVNRPAHFRSHLVYRALRERLCKPRCPESGSSLSLCPGQLLLPAVSISRRTREELQEDSPGTRPFTDRRSEIADSRARRKVPCTRSFAVLARICISAGCAWMIAIPAITRLIAITTHISIIEKPRAWSPPRRAFNFVFCSLTLTPSARPCMKLPVGEAFSRR